jgi:type II secretion system protein I
MSEGWKGGRLEGWKNRKKSGEHSALQSSNLPSFHSSFGFSLLEVLVALAIFGIAAGGILVALGHHLKNVSFLQDHSRAVRIASREINALRRMTSLPEDVTEGSEGRFTWTSQVSTEGLEEWPGLDGASGTPVLLKVTVQWSDSEGGPLTGKVHLDGVEVIGAGD